MRIVSLLPSATETVAALGHRRELVARSAECDAPADVRSLPVAMRARSNDADHSSREIDARVRAVRGRGESLYELDVPMLARLRPNLLLTQDLCGVCSVTEAEVSQACRVAGIEPTILSLTPRTLGEVAEAIDAIGKAVGSAARASELSAALRPVHVAAPRHARPRVAVVEWLDPPILAGLWVPEMVVSAGGAPIGPSPGAPGARTSWRAVRAERPDLVLLSPCSFSVDRTVRELSVSPLANALLRLGAERGVWVSDEAYFSRPGPRLADGILALRALLGDVAVDRPMALQRWDPPGPAVGGAS